MAAASAMRAPEDFYVYLQICFKDYLDVGLDLSSLKEAEKLVEWMHAVMLDTGAPFKYVS